MVRSASALNSLLRRRSTPARATSISRSAGRRSSASTASSSRSRASRRSTRPSSRGSSSDVGASSPARLAGFERPASSTPRTRRPACRASASTRSASAARSRSPSGSSPGRARLREPPACPRASSELSEEHRGLILVTGATGVGKTTTLAAMLGHINRTRRQHIVTIEDPIEFLHDDASCIVNQREVGIDTDSFNEALRRALRQDPDVILIGELRDRETAETALQAAESAPRALDDAHPRRGRDSRPPGRVLPGEQAAAGAVDPRRRPQGRDLAATAAARRRRPRRRRRGDGRERPRPGTDPREQARGGAGGDRRGCVLPDADAHAGVDRPRVRGEVDEETAAPPPPTATTSRSRSRARSRRRRSRSAARQRPTSDDAARWPASTPCACLMPLPLRRLGAAEDGSPSPRCLSCSRSSASSSRRSTQLFTSGLLAERDQTNRIGGAAARAPRARQAPP